MLSATPATAGIGQYLEGSMTPTGASVAASDHVEVHLVSANAAIRPGEPFWVGVRLRMADEWHTYFKNPGASGEQTQIEWTLPEGFTAGSIQWPSPERYDFSGFVNYVYHGEQILAVQITPPAELEPGTPVTLKAMVHWLECAEICIPAYDKALAITLPVTTAAPPAHPQWGPLLEQALAELPQPLADGYAAHFYRDEAAETLTLLVQRTHAAAPQLTDLYFFATDVDGTTGPAPIEPTFDQNFQARGEHAAYTLEFPINPAYPEIPASLRGYLKATTVGPAGETAVTFALVDAPEIDAEAAAEMLSAMPPPESTHVASSITPSLWSLLGAALLGGLILNLMPCVFPVLGVKVVGFVKQAGESRAKVLQHGLIFSAGVLASFWALALTIVLLQQGVLTFIDLDATGWGGWLQVPAFVLVLAMIVFLFALNLSGVFEVGQTFSGKTSRFLGKGGLSGTFLSGMLAVAVGTPCAAPFLAPALTAVFTQSAGVIFLLLTVMGLGLALPYLLLSAFPGWVKRLPKPGPWMGRFKQVMAFPLYATAGYLLWVLSLQADALMLWVVLGFTVIALGAYTYGTFGTSRTLSVRALGKVAAAVLVVGPLSGLLLQLEDRSDADAREALWVAAAERVETLRAERDDVLRAIAEDALKKGNLMYSDLDTHEKRLKVIDAELIRAESAQAQLRATTERIRWEAWSPERQAELIAAGTPVYVDFTARWCVTCQTNKYVYDDPRVVERFREAGVVALRADWTSRDATIAAELARFNRKAIPFNVVYGENAANPVTLPEILTPSAVVEAVQTAVRAARPENSTIAAHR
ncbi:MAG: protein-disulfide reductase DsbD family protein [Opitutales bacterium]